MKELIGGVIRVIRVLQHQVRRRGRRRGGVEECEERAE